MTSCSGYQILLAESDRKLTATSVTYVHPHVKKNFKYWFKNHVELHPWLNHIITPREKKASPPFFSKNINSCCCSKVIWFQNFIFLIHNDTGITISWIDVRGTLWQYLHKPLPDRTASFGCFFPHLNIWATKFYLQKWSCYVKFKLVQLLQGIRGTATKLQQGSCNNLILVLHTIGFWWKEVFQVVECFSS